MANFNNGLCDTNVDPFGIETGRCRWQAENGAIHWTEGFPIFLSEVLTRFWGYQGFGGFYIGAGPHPHPDPNFHLVPEVAATILWNTLGWASALDDTVGMDTDGDNHDANNSKDSVSVGFDAIWDALVNFDPASGDAAHNHPQTIGEFWSAFTYFYPDLANRLSAIYDESHVTATLVYARFIDRAGNVSKSFQDTITLDTVAPVVGAITASPNPFSPQSGQTTIGIRVSDNVSASCSLRIRILNAAGSSVKSMTKTVTCPPGGATTSVTWDGRNAAGASVPAGTYTIEVAATDRAGNAGAVAQGSVVVQ